MKLIVITAILATLATPALSADRNIASYDRNIASYDTKNIASYDTAGK
jgi:hypothetical protein